MSTVAEKAPVAPDNTSKGSKVFADVALVSELKELGWRVEGSGKNWTAYEEKGKDGAEPRTFNATSVRALTSQVKIAMGISLVPDKGNGKAAPKNGNGKADGNGKSGEPFELTNEKPSGDEKPAKKVKQPLLPNTQNAVVEDLRTAILAYRDTTMRVLELQKVQADEKATVMALMHKFEDELKVDPKTGVKSFQAEMIIAELVIEEKEVLKTRTA